MGMGQLRNVHRVRDVEVVVVFRDIRDAYVKDVCGTNWDVGVFCGVLLNDVWVTDQCICDNLLSRVIGGRKVLVVEVRTHPKGCVDT